MLERKNQEAKEGSRFSDGVERKRVESGNSGIERLSERRDRGNRCGHSGKSRARMLTQCFRGSRVFRESFARPRITVLYYRLRRLHWNRGVFARGLYLGMVAYARKGRDRGTRGIGGGIRKCN